LQTKIANKNAGESRSFTLRRRRLQELKWASSSHNTNELKR